MDAIADVSSYLIAVGALLIASAFFSGTEVAMFSLRRVDREHMARSKRRADVLVHQLVSRPRQLIATILIGNEVVNVSISSTMATIGGHWFRVHGELAVALLTTAIALPVVLLVGEVTPKTIAIKVPVMWARMAARPLWLFGVIVTPLRAVVRIVSAILLRPFGIQLGRTAVDAPLGEDEFRALVDAGSTDGEVAPHERRLIHRVFEFGNKTVAQVMTASERAFLLPYNLPWSRILAQVSERGFSRVPIYHKTRDNILGILYAKDMVLLGAGVAAPRRLGELLHEPMYVPLNMRLEHLFGVFKARKTHMAIVVNEYGKLAGLVTMEDLLEEIVGPIRDEKEIRRQRDVGDADSPSPGPTEGGDEPRGQS